MSHQFNCAACKNVWRELVNLIMLHRLDRVAIICGSINSSLSPLKRNIKELVKPCWEKVSPRKSFVTCFQIMVKLLLTKVIVKIFSLAENVIKFCRQGIYQWGILKNSWYTKYSKHRTFSLTDFILFSYVSNWVLFLKCYFARMNGYTYKLFCQPNNFVDLKMTYFWK